MEKSAAALEFVGFIQLLNNRPPSHFLTPSRTYYQSQLSQRRKRRRRIAIFRQRGGGAQIRREFAQFRKIPQIGPLPLRAGGARKWATGNHRQICRDFGGAFGRVAGSPLFADNAPEKEAQHPRQISLKFDKLPQIAPSRRGGVELGIAGDRRRIVRNFGISIGNISGSSIFAVNDAAADEPALAQIPQNTKNPPT